MRSTRDENPDDTSARVAGGGDAHAVSTTPPACATRHLSPAGATLAALAALLGSALVPSGPVPAQQVTASGGPPERGAPATTAAGVPSPRLMATDSTPADSSAGWRLPGRPWEAWARDAAAMASLLTLDRPLRTAAREIRSDATEESAVDRVADRAEWFGDWESSLPWIVGGSLAVGQLTGGYDGLLEAGALLAGGATASMANEALNRAVGRGRPSWEEGAFSLDPFRGHASFPSGHTAYVFGVASGIDVVTDGWLPAAAAYGVAGLTGLSRIYHDRHWLTDVVGSAALSTVVSRLATQQALRVLGVRGDEPTDTGAGRSTGQPGRGADGELRTPSGSRPALEPLLAPYAVGISIRF